ncbi:hypothetical protein Q5752_004388 [Cryptotrichosporon argae]
MSPGRDTLMEINDRLPRSALLDSHINAWFRYLHPVGANGFLHRGTLLRDIQEHKASKNLVVSICAAAGYFVLGAAHEVGLVPSRPLNVDSWSNHAKCSLLLDETVSLDNVATALVLHRHFIYCGRLGLADGMAAHALRQASLLGLLRQTQADTSGVWHQEEYRRRLLWACLHPGPLYTAGADDDLLPRVGTGLRLPLPVEDYNFQLSIRCEATASDLACQQVQYGPTSEIVGVMGQHAIITSARLDAQRYAAAQLRPGHDPMDHPWMDGSTYQRILQRIADWRQNLPSRLEHTSDTIFARSLTGEETPLAMLHAWYHAAMWELHISWTAPVDAAPAGWYEQQRATCLEHAQAFSDVLDLHDRNLPAHVFTDPSLPLLVLEAVKIQLHGRAVAPAALSLDEREALGVIFDGMVKHLFRTARLIWSSGYSIKLLGELYTRHAIPTKLDFTQGGPASTHDVPPFIRKLLRVDREYPGHGGPGMDASGMLGTGLSTVTDFTVVPDQPLGNDPFTALGVGGDFWSAGPAPTDNHDDLLEYLFPTGSEMLIRPDLQNALALPMWDNNAPARFFL